MGQLLLKEKFPEDLADKAHKAFLQGMAYNVRQGHAWNNVKALFVKHCIAYCPIKGMDIGEKYPSPSLRLKGDIDVLVKKREITKARNILLTNGWQSLPLKDAPHHDTCLEKCGVLLELHFSFPEFPEEAMGEIWTAIEANGGAVPLEENLILLHNHCKHHQWRGGKKLLLDTGFLLNGASGVEWEKIREMCRRYHLASPELLVAAFPDFYPESFTAECRVPEDCQREFRQLLLHPAHGSDEQGAAQMNEEMRFSWNWWNKRLRGMGVASIRRQTHNLNGHYLRLAWGYITVIVRKIIKCVKFRNGGSQEMKKHFERVHMADLFGTQ